MTVAVRNFYVEADIDGRQTILGSGPRAKDGNMDVEIYQRDDGRIAHIISIRCRAQGEKLITYVDVLGPGDTHTAVIETSR